MGFIFSSLGAGEILLVLAVALLLFGAEKLPGIARAMGQALNEARRATSEVSSAMMDKDFFLPSGQSSSGQHNRLVIEEGKREG